MEKSIAILCTLLLLCTLSLSAQQQPEAKSSTTAIPVGSLNRCLNNTSSLLFWDGSLWTLNDHYSLRMYALDTASGAIVSELPEGVDLSEVTDMEETAQDEEYLYFGDFGNNHERLRNDLHIIRMAKSEMLSGSCRRDTIWFTYEGYDPDGEGASTLPVTDYDCEAMVAAGDSLYLFTKQWTAHGTRCFALPKTPGFHTAVLRDSMDFIGMATGACYLPEQRLLALCGYNLLCQAFLQVLYDFDGHDFFSGNSLFISLDNGVGHQIEALASLDGLHYFLTQERFSRLGITNEASLMKIDLTDFLGEYLKPDTTTTAIAPVMDGNALRMHPNPTNGQVCLEGKAGCTAVVLDMAGHEMLRLTMASDTVTLPIQQLPRGSYAVLLQEKDGSIIGREMVVKE